nr:hypothetical protein [Streptomyces jeddahensis]
MRFEVGDIDLEFTVELRRPRLRSLGFVDCGASRTIPLSPR